MLILTFCSVILSFQSQLICYGRYTNATIQDLTAFQQGPRYERRGSLMTLQEALAFHWKRKLPWSLSLTSQWPELAHRPLLHYSLAGVPYKLRTFLSLGRAYLPWDEWLAANPSPSREKGSGNSCQLKMTMLPPILLHTGWQSSHRNEAASSLEVRIAHLAS